MATMKQIDVDAANHKELKDYIEYLYQRQCYLKRQVKLIDDNVRYGGALGRSRDDMINLIDMINEKRQWVMDYLEYEKIKDKCKEIFLFDFGFDDDGIAKYRQALYRQKQYVMRKIFILDNDDGRISSFYEDANNKLIEFYEDVEYKLDCIVDILKVNDKRRIVGCDKKRRRSMSKKMVSIEDFEDTYEGMRLYKATLIQRRHYFNDQLKDIDAGKCERGVADRSRKEIVMMLDGISAEIERAKVLMAEKKVKPVKMQVLKDVDRSINDCHRFEDLLSLKSFLMQRKHTYSMALINMDRGKLVGNGVIIYDKKDVAEMVDEISRMIFVVNDAIFDARNDPRQVDEDSFEIFD